MLAPTVGKGLRHPFASIATLPRRGFAVSLTSAQRTAARAVFLSVFCAFFVLNPATPGLAAPGDLIQRVYTDKARYSPNVSATVTVEIKNNTGATWNGTLYLDIRHLETITYSTSQSLNVAAGATTTKTFAWT